MHHTQHLLPNGLRLLTTPVPGGQSVTMLILFPVGSRYEAKRVNGISHFVEHLIFKGTKRRPTTLHIAKELDSLGAAYNAFTSKEYTGYYIKIAQEYAEQAADVLSDILYNSTFDATEVERERGVIIEEIKMYHENPIMHIGDLAEQTIFGDTPLGRSIAGPQSVIARMQRADVVKYFKSQYRLHEAVLSIAGNITPEQSFVLGKKFFSKKLGTGKSSYVEYHHQQRSMRVLNDQREQMTQTQIALLYPAFGHQDRREHALALLSVVLGGNMSSRLFIKIRERLSLCYSIRTNMDQYHGAGYFAVQAGVDASRGQKAVRAIMAELQRAATSGITAREIADAKTYLRGQFSLRLEDSDFVANWYAGQALFSKKIKDPAARMAEFDAVTPQQIKSVAAQVLRPDRLNLTVIGPQAPAEIAHWLR
jgi:predicted Zn-dependent peptidase